MSSFVLWLGASIASASYISLNTSVTSKVEGDKLKVLVSAVNKGDESAYSVQAEVRAGGQVVMAEKNQELGINSRYSGLAEISLAGKTPGQYPLIVVMHYADANQYPFSAPTAQIFSYQDTDQPSDLFGKTNPVTFWKQGRLTAVLKNLGDTSVSGTANLVLPRELSANQAEQPLNIAPKASQTLGFNVENFSALTGSTYQVYILNEYDQDGRHRTNLTSGQIKVKESKQLFGLNAQMLAAALIILVMIFIMMQFGWPIKMK